MKLAISFIFIFCSSFSYAQDCKLKNKSYVILSGPVAMLLKSMGLDNDPNYKATSIFHPVGKEFQGEIIPGGLFISQKIFKKYQNAIFIYDESRELSLNFKRANINSAFALSSNGQDTFAFLDSLWAFMSKHVLVSACQKTYKDKMSKMVVDVKSKISKLKGKKIIVALGEIENKRLPELLIVNDGFVKTLVNYGIFKTYPSKLSYVRWSERLLADFKADLYIGLVANKQQTTFKTVKDGQYINIIKNDLFIPGISQLNLLNYLLDNVLDD